MSVARDGLSEKPIHRMNLRRKGACISVYVMGPAGGMEKIHALYIPLIIVVYSMHTALLYQIVDNMHKLF